MVRIPSCCAWRGPWISTAWPSTRISPESLPSEPLRIFMSVDLPAPFSPSRTCTSPGATSRSTSSRATTPGKDLRTFCMCSRSGRGSGLTDPLARRGGGRANDEAGGEDHAPRLLAVPVDALEQRAQRELAHLDPRLMDGGERDVAEGGQRRVVVADQRDVVGRLEAALLDGIEGADGGEVVGGEDGGRPRPLREQQEAAPVAAFFGICAGDDGHERSEAEPVHRRLVSAATVGGARALTAVDVRDAAMAQGDAVLDRDLRPLAVVVGDAVHGGAARLAPHQHDGDFEARAYDHFVVEHGAAQD